MRVVIFLYNMILYPLSLIINAILIIQCVARQGFSDARKKANAEKHLLMNAGHDPDKLRQWLRGYIYVPDPPMKLINNIIWWILLKRVYISWNFKSTIAAFVLRGGGDCSGHSDTTHRVLKKNGYDPRQYLIYDSALSFVEALGTMHVVTVWTDGEWLYVYNVSNYFKTSSNNAIGDLFKYSALVSINGKPYTYKKPKVQRWL